MCEGRVCERGGVRGEEWRGEGRGARGEIHIINPTMLRDSERERERARERERESACLKCAMLEPRHGPIPTMQ